MPISSSDRQQAPTAQAPVISVHAVQTLIAGLPTPHRALPVGNRIAGQGCHGTTRHVRAAAVSDTSRIRFIYYPVIDATDRHATCHNHLINAEILLARMLAAHANGLRPIAHWLDAAAEVRATVRPPQNRFHPDTLEYRRWYRPDGTARAQPLTQEALSLRLAAHEELSIREARARTAHRSHALSASDQTWLTARRSAPLERRPLNQAEYRRLADALDGIWCESGGHSRVDEANRRIAVKAVAVLAGMINEYVASPFKVTALTEVFNEAHLAHLRQAIENSRQAEADPGVLLAGPKAWFAAKTQRMRAEHQIGLAQNRVSQAKIRLAACPVVAVVGGRLHTFVNGQRSGVGHRAGAAAVNMSFD